MQRDTGKFNTLGRSFYGFFLFYKNLMIVNKLMALCRLYGILFVLSHAIGKTYTTVQSSEVCYKYIFLQKGLRY